MFHTIIVPVDGSEPSDAAVELAIRIAKEDHAVLVFVHAVELNKIVALSGAAPIDPSITIDAACQVGKALLDDTKKKADEAGVPSTIQMPEDQCVPSVLAIARQQKADVIIVGSHGRSGLPRALLGSVAEGILRRSTIPVLVCHAPVRESANLELASAAKAAAQTVL